MTPDFDKIREINPKSFQRYLEIEKRVFETDVAADPDFQRLFSGFYRVRRNKKWRTAYFALFEQMKKADKLSFSAVATALFKETGRVEASFSSKMLATIDPGFPIWDKYVLLNLGLKVPPRTGAEKLAAVIGLYDRMADWYADFLKTEDARRLLTLFDEKYPDLKRKLSAVKKIDFFIWSIR